MHLKPEAVVELARHPSRSRSRAGPALSPTAAADWLEAGRAVERRADERRAAYRDGTPKLTARPSTFIRDGERRTASEPSRLFRAAAEPGGIRLPGFDAWLTPCSPKPPSTRGSRRARRSDRSSAAWLTPGDNGKGVRHERGTLPIDRRPPRRLARRRSRAASRRPSIRSAPASLPGSRSGRDSSPSSAGHRGPGRPP